MDALEAAIAKVQREIDQVEVDAKTATAQGRAEEVRLLHGTEVQLRKHEEQLREERLIALRASGKQYHPKEGCVVCLTANTVSANIQIATTF